MEGLRICGSLADRSIATRWAYRTVFVAQYGVAFLGSIFLPFMPEVRRPSIKDVETVADLRCSPRGGSWAKKTKQRLLGLYPSLGTLRMG